MKAFWLALLERALAALLGGDWDFVKHAVRSFLSDEIPGEEKRQKVFALLRAGGSQVATWLLYAGIEVAYGRLKDRKDF